MSGLNKVLLIGHLGKDPELAYTQDGLGILKFPLATSENYTDKSGEKVENTTWHNVVLFGKMAETLANYLAKGKQIYVEGKIRNSSYDDKDGIKRYKTEIIASNIVLLGKKDENDSQSGQQNGRQEQARPQTQNKQNAQQGQKQQARQQQADEFDSADVPF
jgi:single-strand DNA-binding protein